MTLPILEKPQWLVDFHAYLRAHPIRRAVLWATACWALFQLAHLWRGEPLTAGRLIADAAGWSFGGLLFYGGMRWWEVRDAC